MPNCTYSHITTLNSEWILS